MHRYTFIAILASIAFAAIVLTGCELPPYDEPDISGHMDREMAEIRGTNFFAEGDAMRDDYAEKQEQHK